MHILRAVIGGIVGLLVGYFGVAFLSTVVMGWFGVSDFEGGRGMAAAFLFGPPGGLLGLVGGIWLGLRLGGRQPAGKALKGAGIALLAIVAIAAAGLAIQYFSVPHRLEYDQAGASLEFELRAPPSFALPAIRPRSRPGSTPTSTSSRPSGAIRRCGAKASGTSSPARSSSTTAPHGDCWCSGSPMVATASFVPTSRPSPTRSRAGAHGGRWISSASPASRRP
ncbi:MAG TPA: hypothetical protein VGQ35_01400 [Dongiaceae bacterium]|jgi:hypothetical protein|nr:hypothetical protein [Dongiaceae bacterium]